MMKAWQVILEWLTAADRHQLTVCAETSSGSGLSNGPGLNNGEGKIPCHYHLRVGGWVLGGVPMALHHYISYFSPCSFRDPCHYHLFVFFLGGGPDGSPGSACELPRPHDDIDADDYDDDY